MSSPTTNGGEPAGTPSGPAKEAPKMVADELTWDATSLDPLLSEQRWSQFSKDDSPAKQHPAAAAGTNSPSSSSSPQHAEQAAGPTPVHPVSTGPLPIEAGVAPPSGTISQPQGSTSAGSPSGGISPGASRPQQFTLSQGHPAPQRQQPPPNQQPPPLQQQLQQQPQPTGNPQQQQGQGQQGAEPTILYPMGTGANGAPLFVALTTSQLAAAGGNPQTIINSLGKVSEQSTGGTVSPQQLPQQPGFTASQQQFPPGSGPSPQATVVPVGQQAPQGAAGGPHQATTPSGNIQMVRPPGMPVPIPVPLSTIHVKAAVGVPSTTPKYGNAPLPPGPPPVSPHQLQAQPQQLQAQPQQLQAQPHRLQPQPQSIHTPGGGAATPISSQTPGGATPVLLAVAPQVAGMPPPPQQAQTPPGAKPVGDPVAGEQMMWAAHEHLFSNRAALGEVRPAPAPQQQRHTPQAHSNRGVPSPMAVGQQQQYQQQSGTRSGSGSNATTPSGRAPTKQEMLLQQLQASHPTTTLPPPTSKGATTPSGSGAVPSKAVTTPSPMGKEPAGTPSPAGEDKWSQRAKLEERLVGRKENTSQTTSASSTPVAWKAKPCKSYATTGSCKYGDKCVFAHSEPRALL